MVHQGKARLGMISIANSREASGVSPGQARLGTDESRSGRGRIIFPGTGKYRLFQRDRMSSNIGGRRFPSLLSNTGTLVFGQLCSLGYILDGRRRENRAGANSCSAAAARIDFRLRSRIASGSVGSLLGYWLVIAVVVTSVGLGFDISRTSLTLIKVNLTSALTALFSVSMTSSPGRTLCVPSMSTRLPAYSTLGLPK